MATVVLVTVPEGKAKNLARILLKKRICACINILRGVESLFWWEGKIDTAKEALLVIKTQKSNFAKLKATVKANHPYTVPEIIALDIDRGNKEYLNWLKKETDV